MYCWERECTAAAQPHSGPQRITFPEETSRKYNWKQSVPLYEHCFDIHKEYGALHGVCGTALLWKGESLKKAGLAGFFFSLTVEICQLPQARGTDIDDLWLNTLGAILGYGVFGLMKRYRPLWIPGFRVRETSGQQVKGETK